MARARKIKPELMKDPELREAEKAAGLPIFSMRVVLLQLILHADANGCFPWKLVHLRELILPGEDFPFIAILDALLEGRWIGRFTDEYGDEYGVIRTFLVHQHEAKDEATWCSPPPPDLLSPKARAKFLELEPKRKQRRSSSESGGKKGKRPDRGSGVDRGSPIDRHPPPPPDPNPPMDPVDPPPPQPPRRRAAPAPARPEEEEEQNGNGKGKRGPQPPIDLLPEDRALTIADLEALYRAVWPDRDLPETFERAGRYLLSFDPADLREAWRRALFIDPRPRSFGWIRKVVQDLDEQRRSAGARRRGGGYDPRVGGRGGESRPPAPKPATAADPAWWTEAPTCERCGGTGMTDGARFCDRCGGHGRLLSPEQAAEIESRYQEGAR